MATEEQTVRRTRQGGTPFGEQPVFDAWTAVSFKQALGNFDGRSGRTGPWVAPTWVGGHARRLQAYIILQSYVDNAARFFLTTTDADKRDQHREYGDAALVRDQILGALLGSDQSVAVEDASDFSADLPDDSSAAEKQKSADAEPAHDLQDWFGAWDENEKLAEKLIECERDAVGLGDGVYVLSWNKPKDRVRLRVYDPGFYFPVIDDGDDGDFPSKVHIAWEIEPGVMDRATRRKRIRRITWELRDLPSGGTRKYEWNDESVTTACFMTDAVWELTTDGADVEDFHSASATYLKNSEGVEVKDLDLEIDFLPVVHIPNTIAIKNHYGKSSLASILQVLDDLSNADTDLSLASGTTGNPPIALSGATFGANKPVYKPGEVWELGADGKLTALDTSAALKTLIEYTQELLKRMSVNGRIPEAILGRVSPADVPSGIALRLAFGPLESMVREMRLVRDEKYPLLLKFVWRMATAGRQKDVPKEFRPSRILLGSFLPQDVAGTVETVGALWTAKLISLETGIQMLIEVGVPIEDVIEEIQRIQHRDFAGAVELLDATGDEDAVFKYLGREKPTLSAADLAAQAAVGAGRPPPPNAQPQPAVNLPPVNQLPAAQP